jgi:hypothetical protein
MVPSCETEHHDSEYEQQWACYQHRPEISIVEDRSADYADEDEKKSVDTTDPGNFCGIMWREGIGLIECCEGAKGVDETPTRIVSAMTLAGLERSIDHSYQMLNMTNAEPNTCSHAAVPPSWGFGWVVEIIFEDSFSAMASCSRQDAKDMI